MQSSKEQIRKDRRTTGKVREMLIQMAEGVLAGIVDVDRANAVSLAIKTMNGVTTNEINAAKVALAARGTMHNFGRVVRMGSQTLDEEGVE